MAHSGEPWEIKEAATSFNDMDEATDRVEARARLAGSVSLATISPEIPSSVPRVSAVNSSNRSSMPARRSEPVMQG
ncbi:hypothetical protein [Sphingomonas sp. ZB1N12]|uniref:hypothetical protein n=1 Tax=Sphingomonas arabinosi TaxID=3096160 RepID=UPI002FC5AE02